MDGTRDGTEPGPGVPRRINVRGISGAGKSTFSADLADRLGLAYVELDALYHGPNWSEPTIEEFRARVHAAMDAAAQGWVIDGSYDSKLGEIVVAAADTIIWLDLPFRKIFPRLWKRTIHRIRNNVELWNGNRETWRDQFASRQSIFFWTLRAHLRHRRDWPSRFASDPRLVRLRSDAEVSRWLNALEQWVSKG
jgi:adenylate kinase family enzyme